MILILKKSKSKKSTLQRKPPTPSPPPPPLATKGKGTDRPLRASAPHFTYLKYVSPPQSTTCRCNSWGADAEGGESLVKKEGELCKAKEGEDGLTKTKEPYNRSKFAKNLR